MTSYTITGPAIEHYRDALEQFGHLLEGLMDEQTQRKTHGEVERRVQTEGGELLRRMLQGHFDQRAAQEPVREGVVGEDGCARLHRREGCKRRLETRFGEGVVTRRGYGAPGVGRVFPLDAELNLPPDKYSHGLREVLADEVIRGSFGGAVEHLACAGGGRMAKRQAEEVAVHLSQDFDAFYHRPLVPLQEVADEKAIRVITVDGKGIVMRPEGLREATRKAAEQPVHQQRTRLSPGEKKNRKRMATVVSVYEIDPEQAPEGKRPRPVRKRTWARVEADRGAVIEQGFEEAKRRDPHPRRHWVVLSDGGEELLRQVDAAAKRHRVQITQVQDFVQVLEYLWKAAHALHPEVAEAREGWVLERAQAVLEGRAKAVAVGLLPRRHSQAAEPG